MLPPIIDLAYQIIFGAGFCPVLGLHQAVSKDLVEEKDDVVDAPHSALLVYIRLFTEGFQKVPQIEILLGVLS